MLIYIVNSDNVVKILEKSTECPNFKLTKVEAAKMQIGALPQVQIPIIGIC